jgi:tartrate-resistant acid phosphatase type 5
MAVFTPLNTKPHRRQERRVEIGRARLLLAPLVLLLAWLSASCQALPLPPTAEATRPQPTFVRETDPAPSPSTAPTASPTTVPTATPSATPTPTITATPTNTPVRPVRFAVIGDYGLAGEAEQAVADLVHSWTPDLIITTGDNNYPTGLAETIDHNIGQYYHMYIHPYQGAYGLGAAENRFFPTLGNHDWDAPNAQPYLDYFTLPGNERYYDFTWGPVHFFALNGDSREPDGVGASSMQAAWLRERLASSTAPWKIVYMHQPPYSSGYHGSVTWMRWPYKEWGADAVISGHDHTYERLLIDDLPYFINGLGGGPRYPFQEPLPGSQIRFRDEHGAMLVEATELDIIFQFITRSGIEIDRFVLEK